MKRFSARILAVLLLLTLVVSPVLANSSPDSADPAVPAPAASSGDAAEGAAASEDPSEGDAAASASGEGNAESAAAPGETAPSIPAASSDTYVDPVTGEDLLPTDPSANAVSLRFQDLAAVLEKNNSDIASMKSSLADIKSSGAGDIEMLVRTMEGMADQIRYALDTVSNLASGGDEASQGIYQALALSLNVSLMSVQSQISTMESQIDSMNTSLRTSKNTLADGINQIIKGAETLYVGIATMETALDGLNRTIESLDRAVAIVEKQHELGMASAYDLESINHQRSQAASGLATLQFQIKSNKITLESMCGYAPEGNIKLGALPIPSAEELATVSYSANLTEARSRNVEVMNAKINWDNAESDDHNTYSNTYQAKRDTFAYKYQLICLTVPEKNRLVAAAQSTVDFQQRTFDIAAKKYDLGMLSHEEYLSAQNDLNAAKDDLSTAQLELFTAYRNYIWATTQGIV